MSTVVCRTMASMRCRVSMCPEATPDPSPQGGDDLFTRLGEVAAGLPRRMGALGVLYVHDGEVLHEARGSAGGDRDVHVRVRMRRHRHHRGGTRRSGPVRWWIGGGTARSRVVSGYRRGRGGTWPLGDSTRRAR